jgi:GNAT superfamily N-acetyltransferase
MFSRIVSPEKLAVETAESPEVAARLGAEIAARFGPRDETPLSLVMRDAAGELVAGLNGVLHWRWLYIRHLWVDAAHRGRGRARGLVEEAESFARARAALGAYIDTFDADVADLYEKWGFVRFGEIADFPPGGKRIYLCKRFEAAGNGR